MLKNITGTIKVWRHDHKVSEKITIPLFNTSIGNKKDDGTWANYSLTVKFSKASNAEKLIKSGDEINIKAAWLTVYEDKTKNTHLHLFVNEFELVNPKPKSNAKGSKVVEYTEEQKAHLRSIGIDV